MTFPLPTALRQLVQRLPTEPPSFVLARVLDRLLWPRLEPDVRSRLQGRAVELKVDDLGVAARVKVGDRGFHVAHSGEPVAVRIGATLATYLKLAKGDEDADRLFFERALLMEGDTETALVIKNTLDALGPLWPMPSRT